MQVRQDIWSLHEHEDFFSKSKIQQTLTLSLSSDASQRTVMLDSRLSPHPKRERYQQNIEKRKWMSRLANDKCKVMAQTINQH